MPDYTELNALREALKYFAQSCNFTFQVEDVSPPEGAEVFESDGKRYWYKGAYRLVNKHNGPVLYFDGTRWSRTQRHKVEKVALCAK